MTRWPTTFDSQVWRTLSTPVAMAMPIIPATSAISSPSLFSGIATSRMSRSRNGETTPRPAETTISTRTVVSRARYGRKRRVTVATTPEPAEVRVAKPFSSSHSGAAVQDVLGALIGVPHALDDRALVDEPRRAAGRRG